MSTSKKLFLSLLITLGILGGVASDAYAARNFSITMSNYPIDVTMGDPATNMTYTITNTTTGSASTIVRLTFVAPFGTWAAAQTLPSGWTIRSGGNTATLQIQAGTRIPVNGTLRVTLLLNTIPTLASDNLNGYLTSAAARFSNNSTVTKTNPAQTFLSLHSLLMTLVPSSTSIGQGCFFNLTMTVTNKTNANIVSANFVTSQPKPPLMTSLTGGATATPQAPAPANIVPLNMNVPSTMVWAYQAGANAGTLNLSAYAKDSTGIRTSRTVVTSTITVNATSCTFVVSSLTVTPPCLLSSGTATFTMVVSNTTGIALANVDPPTASLARTGAATIGAFTVVSGPTGTLNTGLTRTFVWTAPITANPADAVGQDYSVNGNATSTTLGYLTTNVVASNLQNIDGYTISISPFSSNTNANSTNEEIVLSVTNLACNSVKRVSVAVPASWPAPSEVYSSVTNSANNLVDTWIFASPAFSTLNYPNPDPDELPVGKRGTFYLLFPTTPVSAATYTFNVTITDNAGVSRLYNYSNEVITVTPYDSSLPGEGNYTDTNIWHEDIK